MNLKVEIGRRLNGLARGTPAPWITAFVLLVLSSFFTWRYWTDLADVPSWRCSAYQGHVLRLERLSDIGIWVAYLWISINIIRMMLKKQHKIHRPYLVVMVLFALFIVACGFTHGIKAVTTYVDVLTLAAYQNVVTVALSLVTAFIFDHMVSYVLAKDSNLDAVDNVVLTNAASRLRAWVVICTTLVLFLTLILVTWNSVYVSNQNAMDRQVSYDALIDLDRAFRLVGRAQNYQRGYIITGDETFLRTYPGSKKQFNGLVNDLSKTVPFAPPKLDHVVKLSNDLYDELEHTLVLRKTVGLDAATKEVLSRRGDNLIEAIRGEVARLRENERARIDQLTDGVRFANNTLLILLPVAGSMGLAIIVVTLLLMRGSDRQKELAWAEKELAWRQKEQTEHQLRRADSFFRTIIDLAPNAVIVADDNGIIRVWNTQAEKTFGYSSAEIVGMLVSSLMPERYRDDHRRGLARSTSTGSTPLARHPLELIGLHKDGHEFPLEVTFDVVDLDGVRNYLSILRDVTERRTAELSLRGLNQQLRQVNNELVRSNGELDQFAAVASHDLKSPLRQVVSYVQLLQRRYADKLDEEACQYIKYAVDGATRMQELINDLLTFSRAGAGEVRLREVDLGRVIELALRNLNGWLAESHATIHRSASLPSVWGDEGLLIQVFQNLISNGVKFAREGVDPEITVEVTPHGQGWQVLVSDNGIGMEQDHLDQIWVMFKRLNGTEYPGTGIGLSIVKKIVERHNGTIRVESKPNQGSSFFVILPAVPI